MHSFPKVNFHSKSTQSPFDDPNAVISSSQKRKSSTKGTSSPALKSSNSRTGYCELCDTIFTHRGQHLRGKQHKSNVTAENFGKLDEMIGGKNMKGSFLRKLRQNRSKRGQKNIMSPTKHQSPLKLSSSSKQPSPDRQLPDSNIATAAIIPIKVVFR